MKLLVVSHSAVVPLYREKYHHMAKGGHDVHLILPAWWPEGNRRIDAPAEGKEQALNIHVLPGGGLGHVGLFHLKRLSDLVNKIDPSLIYAEEEPRSIVSWQLLKLAKKRMCPFFFFSWENIDRFYRIPFNWIYNRVLKYADGGFSGNKEGESVLRKRAFKGEINVIPQYGINPDYFKPVTQPGGKEDKKPMKAAYFGRLLPEKGVHLLIDAVAMAGHTMTLQITGTGYYSKTLKRKVRAMGLADRVSFRESIIHEKMPDALAGIDVVVLPSVTTSKWKEQFGRILIEAMACEIPVIGSDSGEIPHVIKDGGRIFPEGDVKALSRHLLELEKNHKEALRLGRAGRKRVLEHYTTEKIAAATMTVFEKILQVKQ